MSIPGSPNLLLMRQAAAAVPAGPFQLPASCRFSEDDTSALKRTFPVAGNRKTWTWSAWIKLGKLEDDGHLFAAREGSDQNNRLYLKYNSDATLYGYSGNSNHKQFNTLRKLRDPSAWFHVVWVWDSPNAIQRDRQVVWINGELAANITHLTDYTQDFEGAINDAIAHGIGYPPAESTYFDGYLSDVQFVDGMALHPSCWGEFSSTTGDWNPKAFALQTPNNGTTWSSKVSTDNGSYTSGYEATKAFDGLGMTTWTASANGGASAYVAVTNLGFTGNSIVRIHTWTTKLELNGEVVYTSSGGDINNSYAITDFDSLKIYGKADGSKPALYYVEVDGVALVDGKTDNSASINDGRVWSTYMSATGGWLTTNTPDRTFNGVIPNMGNSGVSTYGNDVGGTITFAPTGGIVYKDKVELYTDAGHNYTINGGSSQSFGPASGQSNGTWYTVATGSGTLNTLTWTPQNSGSYRPSSAAMRIDGQLLTDGVQSIYGRNGYKLLSDGFSASRIADIGKDYANGLISTANGGKPILTTTDDPNYGDTTAGSVNTTDNDPSGSSVKSSIVFALSGYTIADVHHTVKGSGSAKTITNNGLTTISSDESRFYGKSIRFNGGQRLSCGSNTDFALGGGDWCIEFWMYADDVSGTEVLVENDTGTGGISIQKNGDDIEVQMGSLFDPGTSLVAEQWYHICVNRDGSTTTLFIDGISQGTTSTDAGTSQAGLEIGQRSSGSFGFSGYLQDIRVYKAESKYGTSNFTPPIRNDWRAVNLEVGTSGVVYSRTHSGTFEGGRGADKAFNGKVGGTDYAHAASGQTCSISWTAITGITQLRLNIAKNSGGDNWGTLELNDTDDITSWLQSNYGGTGNSGTWIDVTSQLTGTSLSKIEFSTSGNNDVRVAGIEVNGNLLVDPFYGDILTDSPTSYGTDTGAGGEIRSNFCTFNSADFINTDSSTLTQGNLTFQGPASSSNWAYAAGTVAVSSADSDGFYFEVNVETEVSDVPIGFLDADVTGLKDGRLNTQYVIGHSSANNTFGVSLISNGYTANYGTLASSTGPTWNSGDIVQIALKDNKIWIGVNNTWYGSGAPADGNNPTLSLPATLPKRLRPYVGLLGDGSNRALVHLNTGARQFRYSAPSGFKPFCSNSLPTPTIAKPSDHFDAITWTGDGSATRNLVYPFSPDFIWIKSRSANGWQHVLYDRIRGAGSGSTTTSLSTNDTRSAASGNDTNHGYLSAFNSDGVTVTKGSQSGGDYVNHDGWGYVGWSWDAGSAASGANNNGSINISSGDQWVNNAVGFSITKYTGTGSDATFGHGLSTKPEWIIIKKVNSSGNWTCQHVGATLGSGRLILDENYANDTTNADTYWNSTAPTNTLISVGDHTNTNGSGDTFICYAWAPVANFSSFGVYKGNNSNDGSYVHCGFAPKLVMVKTTNTTGNWVMYDRARRDYNENPYVLLADTTDAGSTNDAWVGSYPIDFLSNGFKLRGNTGEMNSTNDFIYMAWAESTFSTATAR